jgi:hypothetical protein
MKPNSKTQDDSNLNFDGMEKIAPKRSTKYQTNQWSGHMNDGRNVNFGRGPTKGNQDHAAKKVGPPATFDSYRGTPTTKSVPAVPAQGSVRDSINRGPQVRTPGGTRTWDPKCEQNYKGNIDKINAGNNGPAGPGVFKGF